MKINPSYRLQRFVKKTFEGYFLPFNANDEEDWTCPCGKSLSHFGDRIECLSCKKIIWRLKDES